MGKSRRASRDQLRARQETALEKKWREEEFQRAMTRARKQVAEIDKELAEDTAEEKRYEQGLASAYGDVPDDVLYRRLRDIEEELLRTTTEARDLVEMMHEMRDEIYRRNGRL
jgi:hypothetical protein